MICKRCVTCKQELPLSEFHNNPKTPDGKRGTCKNCTNARLAKWRAKNRDRVNGYGRKHYWKDPEKSRKRSNAWAAANKDKAKELKMKWRAERPLADRWNSLNDRGVKGLGSTREEFYEIYNRMWDAQDGRCASCRIEFKSKYGLNGPQVDHCHKTGYVRALVCRPCNVFAGYIETERYQQVLEYLSNYNPVIGSPLQPGSTESSHTS